MILGKDIKLPDDSPEEEEVSDNWKKRQVYEHKNKETARNQQFLERERYNPSHKEKPVKLNRRREESWKMEDRKYREYSQGQG